MSVRIPISWSGTPRREKAISAKSQQSAIDYNVFEGKKQKGLPRFTLTRGVVAVNDGKVETREGHGEFVARKAGNPVNRALSSWKELTAPRPVSRTGIPASGVWAWKRSRWSSAAVRAWARRSAAVAADGFRLGVLSTSGKGEALGQELGGIGVWIKNQAEADIGRLVAAAMEAWGRIDVVVNSAGHGPRAPLLELNGADWHRGMESCS